MNKFLVSALAVLAVSGCQSASRKPALHSPQVEAEAISAYHQQISLDLLEEQRVAADREADRTGDETALEQVEVRIKNAEQSLEHWKQSLGRQSTRASTPVVSRLEYNTPWRHQVEEFQVSNIDNYVFNSPQPTRKYFMATQGARPYELLLKQTITPKKVYLNAQVTCDQPFALSLDGRSKDYPAGGAASFNWESEEGDPNAKLRLTLQNSHCSLRFKNLQSTVWSGVQLRPETEQFGDLTKLTRQFQVCSLPSNEHLTGVEKFFLSSSYSSATCPESANFTLAGQAIQGLTERMKILTGSELPQKVIDARNPFVELDFSKAPKLDLIVVTSLVFRSDFYGQLLAKALVWHAQRGTIVRILNSKVLELGKDRIMFNDMMAISDNIKVQTYQFDSHDSRIKSKINELHRVSHVKLFATYSRSNPSASKVIIGGRNVHEGFILPVAMERFGLPQLIDYIKGEDSYLYYRDVEAIVHSQDFAHSVIGHFLSFWQRQPNAFIRSMSLNLKSGAQADPNYFKSSTPLVRHVLSLPYKDKRELNDLYADLIDSAEREIKITTPYFLPTKKVGKALERAIKRGVSVTVITKMEIVGDNPQFDHLTSAANQIAVNKYWETLKFYDYTVPNSLLHSKLVLVDGKVSVVGSVNLNRRSFYHDVENATILYSPAFTQQLLGMYNEFLAVSKPVEAKKKVPFLKRLIVSIIDKEL